MSMLVLGAARRPIATIMVWIGALTLGAVAASGIPLEYLPDIRVPRVIVSASYPGLPADEMRTLVALPLEDALSSVKGAIGVSSVSREGRSTAIVDFRWGEEILASSMRVREAIDSAYGALPEGTEKPVVLPYDPGESPCIVAAVRARDGNLVEARRFAELEIKTRLQQASGVGAVTLVGGAEIEIVVAVDQEKAAARGLGTAQIAQALSRENVEYPVGVIKEGNGELSVRAGRRALTLEALADIRIRTQGRSFVLGETATVSEGIKRRESVFIYGGDEWVGLEIFRRKGISPALASASVRAELARLEKSQGANFEFVIASDASVPIVTSIRNLAASAALGALIAFLVLVVFTRDLASSLMLISTIPVSITVALAALKLCGISINTMSLGGLSLGIGMISDNAVVVLDRLRSESGGRASTPEIVAKRVGEVSGSIFASTLTSVIVFLPIVFLPGELGAMFADLSWAFIFSISASWISAMTLIPALYRMAQGMKQKKSARAKPAKSGLIYGKILRAGFRRPVVVSLSVILVVVAGACAVLSLPSEFMPADDAGAVLIEAEFRPGTDIETEAVYLKILNARLTAMPGVLSARARSGGDKRDARYHANPESRLELASVVCVLDPRSFPSSSRAAVVVASSIKQAGFGVQDGVRICVAPPSSPMSELLGFGASSMAIVRSDSQSGAVQAADMFVARLEAAAGPALASTIVTPSGMKPAIRVEPDRSALSLAGIGFQDAARSSAFALVGDEVSSLERSGREIGIRVKAAGSFNYEDLGGLVVSPGGKSSDGRNSPRALLSDIAAVSREASSPAAAREFRADVKYVQAIANPGMERELGQALKKVAVGTVSLKAGNAFETYSASLIFVVVLVVLLLYLTLGAQFESFTLPFLLLGAIPLSFSGVALALLLSRSSLNFGSVLGVVVLFGVSVNNTIMLWEESLARFNRHGAFLPSGSVERFRAARSAAYRGGRDRLRPILITILTSVLALVPVALSPSGAAQRSMAAALLGGLLMSTALSLISVPLVFARTLFRLEPRLKVQLEITEDLP